MTARIRLPAPGPLAAAAIAMPQSASAQLRRTDAEQIIHQYLAAHPEELAAKRAQAQPGFSKQNQAIDDNAKALFEAPLQMTLGAAQGSATVVESFGLNCGFC